MFRNNKECRYARKCPRYDAGDEFCYEDGGIRTDGRPAQCYRNMNLFYRIIDALTLTFRNTSRRNAKAKATLESV